jgi:hypothetical protein
MLNARWQRILHSSEEDEWLFTILPSSSSNFQMRISRAGSSDSFRVPHAHDRDTHAPLGKVVGPNIDVHQIRSHPACSAELASLLDLTVTNDLIQRFLPSLKPPPGEAPWPRQPGCAGVQVPGGENRCLAVPLFALLFSIRSLSTRLHYQL